MTTVLIVAQIFIVLLLILLVLLQKSDSDAVSSLGGGNNLVSPHAANNIITKATMFLGVLFICNSIAIARIAYVESGKANKIIENIESNSSPIKRLDKSEPETKESNESPNTQEDKTINDSKNKTPRVE